jgi:hypothetical protein
VRQSLGRGGLVRLLTEKRRYPGSIAVLQVRLHPMVQWLGERRCSMTLFSTRQAGCPTAKRGDIVRGYASQREYRRPARLADQPGPAGVRCWRRGHRLPQKIAYRLATWPARCTPAHQKPSARSRCANMLSSSRVRARHTRPQVDRALARGAAPANRCTVLPRERKITTGQAVKLPKRSRHQSPKAAAYGQKYSPRRDWLPGLLTAHARDVRKNGTGQRRSGKSRSTPVNSRELGNPR